MVEGGGTEFLHQGVERLLRGDDLLLLGRGVVGVGGVDRKEDGLGREGVEQVPGLEGRVAEEGHHGDLEVGHWKTEFMT